MAWNLRLIFSARRQKAPANSRNCLVTTGLGLEYDIPHSSLRDPPQHHKAA